MNKFFIIWKASCIDILNYRIIKSKKVDKNLNELIHI